MQYKIKHEKSNIVFMTSVMIMCLLTCVIWFVLREYSYFIIYLIATLLVFHIYYFTYYYIKENYLLIKLGFIKIKFKYKNINNIENKKEGIKLKFNNLSMNIYPSNKDIFYAELLNKVKGI